MNNQLHFKNHKIRKKTRSLTNNEKDFPAGGLVKFHLALVGRNVVFECVVDGGLDVWRRKHVPS